MAEPTTTSEISELTENPTTSAELSSNVVDVSAGYVDFTDGVKLYYELRSPKQFPLEEPAVKLVMIMGAFCTLKHFEEHAEYIVRHFAEKGKKVQVLTYDHRCIGKSSAPVTKQTSQSLADDAIALINKVWDESSTVHVFGASMGGMVAQQLAVKLIKAKRLRSLYLNVTSRGYYLRPFAPISTNIWKHVLSAFFIQKDRERMVREVVVPSVLSNETAKTKGDHYAQIWIKNFDDWFAFSNVEACANQISVFNSHYLKFDDAVQIRTSGLPITVQISLKDKVIPVAKQREMANLLTADTVIFDQGHAVDLGNEILKIQNFHAVVRHLQKAL